MVLELLLLYNTVEHTIVKGESTTHYSIIVRTLIRGVSILYRTIGRFYTTSTLTSLH